MTPRERFAAFFEGRPVDRPMNHPLCMKIAARLAGRPYRQYATDAHVLAEAQISLAEAHGVEVLSVCSDPVRELADLGGSIQWFDDDPPMADPNRPLIDHHDRLHDLDVPNPHRGARMLDRVLAVERLRTRGGWRFPVQGWVEGPISFAVAVRGMTQVMEDLMDAPAFAKDLLGFGTDVAIRFAQAQVDAGADLLGIGDAPASLMNGQMYSELVLPEEQRLISAIRKMGAYSKLHICGNTNHLLPALGWTGADLIDLDSGVDLIRARNCFPATVAILGNLDPVREVRGSVPRAIENHVERCAHEVGPRYVVGAGCEIPADTPVANLEALHAAAIQLTLATHSIRAQLQ